MTNPLLQVPWEVCLLEPKQDRALARELKRELGKVPRWSRYFWASPWFAKAAIRLEFTNGLLLKLDFDLATLVALVVSRENSCRYCYATIRTVMRMLGLGEARLQAVETELAAGELDPRRAAAVNFARAVNRGHQIDGRGERARLAAAGFAPDEIRELAYVAATMGFMNRVTTIAALPPTLWERASDSWLMQLSQPLLAPLVKRMLQRGTPVAAAATESPLSARLRACYKNSPIQSVLADSMRDMWASERLPQRSKLLMLATIAQGIDCAVCAQEIARLADAAALDVGEINRAAAHLDDPTLDSSERQLCEFARESLWYEPQIIQRKARALCEHLGEPRFVEALAIVALGNLLMRLAATMVDPP
ncbi:MAG: hypothetical protein WD928_10275 [Gammaproteobacteria bacterium]